MIGIRNSWISTLKWWISIRNSQLITRVLLFLVKLPEELRNSKKGLIKIKNNDQKYFLWCHVRHINPVQIHIERITQEDKRLANDLNYDGIEFPVREKGFSKTETKNNIYMNVFCYKDGLTIPVYVSDQKLKNSMDLLLVINDDKSHYVYIKDFKRFMFHKTKNKNKKCFCKSCLRSFSSKNMLTVHKEDCFSINGPQSVRLEKGTIGFKIISNKYPLHWKFMLILTLL